MHHIFCKKQPYIKLNEQPDLLASIDFNHGFVVVNPDLPHTYEQNGDY